MRVSYTFNAHGRARAFRSLSTTPYGTAPPAPRFSYPDPLPPLPPPSPAPSLPCPLPPLPPASSRLQVLGALLLYYAAAILRGAPPALNLEFGLGCLVVCTLLPLANRLLVVPRAA